MSLMDVVAKWNVSKAGNREADASAATITAPTPLLDARFDVSDVSAVVDTSKADGATLTPQQLIEEFALLSARKNAGLPSLSRPIETHTLFYLHRYAAAMREAEEDGVTPEEWLAHAKALANKYAVDLVAPASEDPPAAPGFLARTWNHVKSFFA